MAGLGREEGLERLAGKAGRGQELLLQPQLEVKILQQAPSQASHFSESIQYIWSQGDLSLLRARWINARRANLPCAKNINHHQNDQHMARRDFGNSRSCFYEIS